MRAFIPELDLKDVGKFAVAPEGADYVAYLDDDLIYPPDYIARMLELYSALEGMDVVLGLHAVIYSDFFDGAHTSRYVRVFSELIERPFLVNQLGTGTVVARAEFAPPFDFMQGSQRFVDVRYARYCHERGIARICVPRALNWLREVAVETPSIFAEFTKSPNEAYYQEIRAFGGFARLDPAAATELQARRFPKVQ